LWSIGLAMEFFRAEIISKFGSAIAESRVDALLWVR